MKRGTLKTTIGNPDTYFRKENGKYICVAYTAQQSDIFKKGPVARFFPTVIQSPPVTITIGIHPFHPGSQRLIISLSTPLEIERHIQANSLKGQKRIQNASEFGICRSTNHFIIVIPNGSQAAVFFRFPDRFPKKAQPSRHRVILLLRIKVPVSWFHFYCSHHSSLPAYP